MKIIRNGQEFELTPKEMKQVYYEMKDEYAIEDIRSRYIMPDDKIDEALKTLERIVDSNDIFWDSYWSMIEYVSEKIGLKEIEDKRGISLWKIKIT